MSTSDRWLSKAQALRDAFTPSAPVTDRELFAGRSTQLVRLADTFDARGDHAAVFGERGVGKTSLATIATTIARLRGYVSLRINCQADDELRDVWRRVGEALDRFVRVSEARGDDIGSLVDVAPAAVELLTLPSVGAHEVLTALEMLADTGPVVVFLDEFDRLGDHRIKSMLVDLMKTVADQGLNVTIVVVGVSDDVDNLLEEHESTGRGLNQIEMPRMSLDELREIVDRGLGPAEMDASEDAKSFIASLSMGLPHYTHLMALHSGLSAVARESNVIELEDVLAALPASAERAQQHVRSLYHSATHSTQQNIFREVLLATCLTHTDERGYFAPGDVRDSLESIMGRRYEIPAFARHLAQFAEERGPVLQKSGRENRPRYRFVEPLLVPYACMRGLSEELIHIDDMFALLRRRGTVA